MSSGSTSIRVPSPVQSGQAPHGELKLNDRGSSSSNDRSSYRQARCSEYIRSRCGSSSGRSMKSRMTTPPASPSAVSTESVSRRRAVSFTASRSMTTSMSCFSYFFSAGRTRRVVRDLVQPDDRAVDAGAGVALGLQLLEQLGVLALAAADDGGEHLEPGALLKLEHPVHDLLRGLPGDRAAADRAVRLAGAGVQQPQVVVHLGDRADGGPRVAARRLLVDGDRGGQPVDEVDVRLVHLAEELPGVRRQRLHVPPLALGEDRVERQA